MSTNARRFGEIVRQRREDLDLNQMEVWQAGGPSNTTLTEIENGRAKSLVRKTAQKLDRGLQWEPGSAKRAWNGGEPTPARGTRSDFLAKVESSDLDDETKRYILDRLGRDDPSTSDRRETG